MQQRVMCSFSGTAQKTQKNEKSRSETLPQGSSKCNNLFIRAPRQKLFGSQDKDCVQFSNCIPVSVHFKKNSAGRFPSQSVAKLHSFISISICIGSIFNANLYISVDNIINDSYGKP